MQNSIERLFWAGNQGNHQNFKKIYIPHMKPKVVFVHKCATPGFDNSKITYMLTYLLSTYCAVNAIKWNWSSTDMCTAQKSRDQRLCKYKRHNMKECRYVPGTLPSAQQCIRCHLTKLSIPGAINKTLNIFLKIAYALVYEMSKALERLLGWI